MRQFADDFVKRRLDAVPGVAAVIVAGGFEEEVRADRSGAASAARSQCSRPSQPTASNQRTSPGSLKEGDKSTWFARSTSSRQSKILVMPSFMRQVVASSARDVAEVKEGAKDRDAVMRVNGREAVEIAIYKEGDGNTVAVAANVEKRSSACSRIWATRCRQR